MLPPKNLPAKKKKKEEEEEEAGGYRCQKAKKKVVKEDSDDDDVFDDSSDSDDDLNLQQEALKACIRKFIKKSDDVASLPWAPSRGTSLPSLAKRRTKRTRRSSSRRL